MTIRSTIWDLFVAAKNSECRSFRIGHRSLELQLHPNVFPPMPISIALAESLPEMTGGRVADIGTGTGILAISAAMRGAGMVLATDINPAAVDVAKGNVSRAGFGETCNVVEACWLPPDAGPFDLIVSNPPCMPVSLTNGENGMELSFQQAIDGGSTGSDGILSVLRVAKRRLTSSGKLIVPIPHWYESDQIDRLSRFLGFRLKKIRSLTLPYWVHFVYEGAETWDVTSVLGESPVLVDIVEARLKEQQS